MTFLTPALIAGAALIGVPIALHLIMRRRSQSLVFPALRFVRNRRTQNQTRLRLRHLLLLLLRCAAIALLALALARPIWQGSGLKGGKGGASGVAVVLDNSARMTYRSKNNTRLDEAKDLAGWLIGRLPSDSQVVVTGLSATGAARIVDRDAALLRAGRVRPTTRARPLAAAARSALSSLADADFAKQELFLVSDRTVGGLSDAALADLARTIEDFPQAKLTLVDVGVDRPVNAGLTPIELSASTIATGQPLSLRSRLAIAGPPPETPLQLELWLEGHQGPEKRGGQLIADPKPNMPIEFSLAALPEGVHQGYVRIVGSDPLPADNTQFFTAMVEAPRRVLLLSQLPASPVFVKEALAPSTSPGAQVYEVDTLSYQDRWKTELGAYRAVVLLDPPPLAPGAWRTLANYVSRGGAAGIALGRNAALREFNAPDAQQLLPGKLQLRSRDQTYLRPRSYTHPAIAQLAELAEALPWSEFPVFTYWGLAELDPSTVIVARYANGDPAILERRIDSGRTLTITTSLSDPASSAPWNLLPTGIDPWPFLALVDNLTGYLCGAAETRYNYSPGEVVTLPLADGQPAPGYVLRLPSGDAVRQTLPVGATQVSVGMTEEVGNYRLDSGGRSGGLDAGFSVSPTAETSRLERRSEEEIVEALPPGRCRIVASRDDLAEHIQVGTAGRELYAWIIPLVAMAMAAEHLISNKFYERSEAGD